MISIIVVVLVLCIVNLVYSSPIILFGDWHCKYIYVYINKNKKNPYFYIKIGHIG